MSAAKRSHVLVFPDRVGISEGYRSIWDRLLRENGLGERDVRVSIRSTYNTFSANQILEWRPPSKLPGFNTNEHTQEALRRWVEEAVATHKPDAILCMDPALLFMYNPVWNQAKLDTLRGGVYIISGIPHLVSFPVTAFHSKAKPRDLAKLNDGFIEKADFDEYQNEITIEEDSDEDDSSDEEAVTFDRDSDDDKHVTRHMMQWHDPIVVPYGRIVLGFDLQKLARILERIRNHEASDFT